MYSESIKVDSPTLLLAMDFYTKKGVWSHSECYYSEMNRRKFTMSIQLLSNIECEMRKWNYNLC